jgi:rRNA-processing protein FCF1
MKCALLDTNFLMIPGKFKVDVFSELSRLGYEPVVLSCVMSEVNKIASGGGRAGEQARVARAVLDVRKPKMVAARGPADAALIKHAIAHNCAIATNDAALIAHAKKKGVAVLRLRQKKFVAEA